MSGTSTDSTSLRVVLQPSTNPTLAFLAGLFGPVTIGGSYEDEVESWWDLRSMESLKQAIDSLRQGLDDAAEGTSKVLDELLKEYEKRLKSKSSTEDGNENGSSESEKNAEEATPEEVSQEDEQAQAVSSSTGAKEEGSQQP